MIGGNVREKSESGATLEISEQREDEVWISRMIHVYGYIGVNYLHNTVDIELFDNDNASKWASSGESVGNRGFR